MKKLIYILTAAALVQAACTNLDERVYDQLTADDYFDNFTEEDIPAALGSVYSDLRTLYAGRQRPHRGLLALHQRRDR